MIVVTHVGDHSMTIMILVDDHLMIIMTTGIVVVVQSPASNVLMAKVQF